MAYVQEYIATWHYSSWNNQISKNILRPTGTIAALIHFVGNQSVHGVHPTQSISPE
jgi:hypothetical protein